MHSHTSFFVLLTGGGERGNACVGAELNFGDIAMQIQGDYTEEEMVALVKEMEIMKKMKECPHPNIIKLVGVCTKGGKLLMS